MKLTITAKFVGALIGTLVISCAIIICTCLYYMSMPVEEELSANIRRIQTIVDNTNQATTANFVRFAALLAEREELSHAVAARDADKVRALSQQAMRKAGSDFMTVTDAKGKVIARGHSEKTNDDVTNQQTVVMALKGKSSACVVSGTEVPFTIRASNPILLDGKLVGTLSIGTSLVSPNYVDWLKKMGELEVTIFKNDTRVMTTIMGQDGKRALGTKIQTQEVLDKVLSQGQTLFTRNNILGVHYQSAYWPIQDLNGKIIGMWFVGAPINKLLYLEDKAIHTTLLVSGGVLLLMVLLAMWLGIRLAKPIKKISAYAQAVGTGRNDAQLDVYGRDDMGVLADLLRGMVAKLKEQALWFKNILDSVPYGISVTDMDMRWTFINKKALSTMGKSDMAEVLGQHCSAKGGALCGTENCGIKALRRGQAEVINKQPNGNILQMRLGYLTDSVGNKVGHVELGIDITEQERLREESALAVVKARRETALQLEEVVTRLAGASETLSQHINNAEHDAKEVAQRMRGTAESMEAMNDSVTDVARNAADAAQSSGEVQHNAADGEKIVAAAVSDIQNVQRLSQGLKTDMESLNKQASGIGGILNMIRDIADQTNLLALNAAIEAARAGEAGRGFAVVADEVRKLAEKSMTATKDVEEAIAAIQRGTSQSAGTVDTAVEAIRTATSLAQESGTALRNIVQISGRASDKVQTIAAAAEEQAVTTKEINARVEEANQMTGAVSSSMRNAMQAVHDLAEQAGILRSVLNEVAKE